MCRTHPETFIRDVALFLLLALVIVLYFVGHFGVTGYKMYSPFQYLQLFLYAPLGLYRIWIYAAKISRNLVKLKVNWLLLLFRFSQVIVNTVDLCHQKVGAWAEASLAQCFKRYHVETTAGFQTQPMTSSTWWRTTWCAPCCTVTPSRAGSSSSRQRWYSVTGCIDTPEIALENWYK